MQRELKCSHWKFILIYLNYKARLALALLTIDNYKKYVRGSF